ncbi:MAG: glycosyltransferase family 2 protein [Candidatus Pacebacteria bacterium]|nr:glycosyltransferase family 2 protein [Candidatus Paceibacterota bacterium]
MAHIQPAVSIILPVYNGETYIKEAVDSILSQTFSNFELIIINDGSTDRTKEIIKSYTDYRIHYLENEVNRGIVTSLNKGLNVSKGKYIARMDADDISLSERIKTQVAFMDTNPKVSISGTLVSLFGSKNKDVCDPVSDTTMAAMLLGNQIESTTAIIRAQDIKEKNVTYADTYRYENEYDFYVRAIMSGLHIANIPQVLTQKRIHANQLSTYYEGRVHAIELAQIQKMYFHFLIKKLAFLHPLYVLPLCTYVVKRITNTVSYLYKKIYLRKKEYEFYKVSFDVCEHINCTNSQLKDKNILDLATVAFNKPEVIAWQIKLIRKNITDPYFYTVFDNSTDTDKAEEIKRLCAAEKIAYVKLPKNYLTRSASHGSSLNWIYKNYFNKRNAHYFGFLDHDIFPIKKTGVISILDAQSIFGHLQIRKNNLWYLWAGFCFFKSNAVVQPNFMNGKIGGVGVDTGGMNWKHLYSKLDKTKIEFPVSSYVAITDAGTPKTKVMDPSVDMIEYLGDWMHLFGSSGWKTLRNREERNAKIQTLINSLL